MVKILTLTDTRLQLYISYFFWIKVVNLTEVKGVELRSIVLPFLDEHYAGGTAGETTTDYVQWHQACIGCKPCKKLCWMGLQCK